MPPHLATRFADQLGRLWPEGQPMGLAVSGGTDSLALLLLAEAAVPGRFEVASVDHGLRPEAAAECERVKAICSARGIACEILRVSVEAGNLQDRARQARYTALSAWLARRGLSGLATAHHADDQAETLLMRLNRGSGVAGLAGVRERGTVPGSAIPLLRPLLGFRRSELEGVVRAAGLNPIHDPSNEDDRFDRVQIRKALVGAGWLDRMKAAETARHLADAEEALDWALGREWGENVSQEEELIRYRPAAPKLIRLRIAARAIARFGSEPRGSEVARLVERLERDGSGNLAGVIVRVQRGEWVFRREPPRRGPA